jgi:hypothetical protein
MSPSGYSLWRIRAQGGEFFVLERVYGCSHMSESTERPRPHALRIQWQLVARRPFARRLASGLSARIC